MLCSIFHIVIYHVVYFVFILIFVTHGVSISIHVLIYKLFKSETTLTLLLYYYSFFTLFTFDQCPEILSESPFNCSTTRLLPAALVRVSLIFLYIPPCNCAVTQLHLSLQMPTTQVFLKRSAFCWMFSMSKGLQEHFPSRRIAVNLNTLLEWLFDTGWPQAVIATDGESDSTHHL